MSDPPDDDPLPKKGSGLPPPPGVRALPDDREARKANARAVGVDTAFLEALGDEFANAPAPAGKYGRGGTLVMGSSTPARERDEVLTRAFLEDEAPPADLGAAHTDGLLFETAASPDTQSAALNLPSGRFEPVGDDGEVPSVLAAFDSGQGAATSGSELVVSVDVAGAELDAAKPDALATDRPDAAVTTADCGQAERALEPVRTRAGTEIAAAPASPVTGTNATDHRKIAMYVAVGILVLIASVAVMRGGSSETPAPAASVRTGGGHAADDGRAAGQAEGARADALRAAEATGSAAADGGVSDGDLPDGDLPDGEITDDNIVVGGGLAAPDKPPREPETRTAAELRAAARDAIEQRKFAEAYRLAGLAQRQSPGESALALRTEAACGMKNRDAAKRSFDKITLGKQRRELRAKCRTLGTRVGL